MSGMVMRVVLIIIFALVKTRILLVDATSSPSDNSCDCDCHGTTYSTANTGDNACQEDAPTLGFATNADCCVTNPWVNDEIQHCCVSGIISSCTSPPPTFCILSSTTSCDGTLHEMVQRTGADNPANSVQMNVQRSNPALIDFDGDTDLDLCVGTEAGNILFFENTGSITSPEFEARTGSQNPFKDVDVIRSAAPTLMDYDYDGDIDLLVSGYAGDIWYYENTGSANVPVYTKKTPNPMISTKRLHAQATFVDFDADGDYDVWCGNIYGKLQYYENTGTSTNPIYSNTPNPNNPMKDVDVSKIGSYSTPFLLDFDNDSDLDFFVGNGDGYVKYFENTGSASNPVFTERTGEQNPLAAVKILSKHATPFFVDFDGDGDIDGKSILFTLTNKLTGTLTERH